MKTILSVLAFILCMGVATSGFAGEKSAIETWECHEQNASEIIVKTYVYEGGKTGKIKVKGVFEWLTYDDAYFTILNSNRMWGYGLNFDYRDSYGNRSPQYDYVFNIYPNGNAYMHKYIEKPGENGQLFKCEMK